MLTSIIDNDLYKLTQQQAVLEKYPHAQVTYNFTNRRLTDRFNQNFIDELHNALKEQKKLSLISDEKKWLTDRTPYLKPQYLDYLQNYRFNPDEVNIKLNEDGKLEITISGLWHRTILWEVPLMAIISECYFKHCDTNWIWDREDQQSKAVDKAERLQNAGCRWADFGTRRRRNFETQEIVVQEMSGWKNFLGTSNVLLAKDYDQTPIGTMAHEWIMGISVLEGLRHANRFALHKWNEVYQGNLGIALTDTYGTDVFFKDFDPVLSRLFDGVRQDSGCPFQFIDKVETHYKSLKINPMSKSTVFSDGLSTDLAIKIQEASKNRINPVYGIGTHFTNDFGDSKPLNMVIKLYSVDGIPVVKLSDDPGKAQGERDAIRIAKHTFLGEPLDG